MEPDWWLELESTYKERIKQRVELFEKHQERIVQAQTGSETPCKELMEMVVQFLCARYPQYFHLDRETLTLHNRILNTIYKLKELPPLQVILQNCPEDFAIVIKNPVTGKYTFRAGVICSSLGWDVSTKIGKDLSEIHAVIPDYKEKMAMSMDR